MLCIILRILIFLNQGHAGLRLRVPARGAERLVHGEPDGRRRLQVQLLLGPQGGAHPRSVVFIEVL